MDALPTTPRGAAPATYSRFDIPILHKRDRVPGSGMKVDMHLMHARTATINTDHLAEVDMRIAKGIGEFLHSHFRGHFWQVYVDSQQNLVTITIPILLGNWKYSYRLSDFDMGKALKAGGEILERFGIPRSAIDVPAFCEARKKSVSRISQKPPGGV